MNLEILFFITSKKQTFLLKSLYPQQIPKLNSWALIRPELKENSLHTVTKEKRYFYPKITTTRLFIFKMRNSQ